MLDAQFVERGNSGGVEKHCPTRQDVVANLALPSEEECRDHVAVGDQRKLWCALGSQACEPILDPTPG